MVAVRYHNVNAINAPSPSFFQCLGRTVCEDWRSMCRGEQEDSVRESAFEERVGEKEVFLFLAPTKIYFESCLS